MRAALGLPDDLALLDGLEDLEIAQVVNIDLERVVLHDAEVGQLANLEGALAILLAVLERTVLGDALETLVDGDLLGLVQLNSVLGDALDRAPHALEQVRAQHRAVGVEGRAQAEVEGIADRCSLLENREMQVVH